MQSGARVSQAALPSADSKNEEKAGVKIPLSSHLRAVQQTFHFLSPKELSSAMCVNRSLSKELQADKYWISHARKLGVCDGSKQSFFTQFKDKRSELIKQKAELLARTFLNGPAGYAGWITWGFTAVPQEFLIAAIPFLQEKVFNDVENHPAIAIIDCALSSFNLQHNSCCANDENGTQLLHVLAVMDDASILESYLKKYKKHVNLNSKRKEDDACALELALFPDEFEVDAAGHPKIENIIVLLKYGARTTSIDDRLSSFSPISVSESVRNKIENALANGANKEAMTKLFGIDFELERRAPSCPS